MEIRDAIEDHGRQAMERARKAQHTYLSKILLGELGRQARLGYPSIHNPNNIIHPMVGPKQGNLTPLSGGFDLDAVVSALQRAMER